MIIISSIPKCWIPTAHGLSPRCPTVGQFPCTVSKSQVVLSLCQCSPAAAMYDKTELCASATDDFKVSITAASQAADTTTGQSVSNQSRHSYLSLYTQNCISRPAVNGILCGTVLP